MRIGRGPVDRHWRVPHAARSGGLAAAGYGVAFGLLPIGWIVLNAIFIYDVSVHTGQFEIVKQGIAALSSDRRIQTLLIAFSFGAFVEGAAGFGTPVAISAAACWSDLGFKPLQAAELVAVGKYGSRGIRRAMGTPRSLTLRQRSRTSIWAHSSAMVGRQLPFFSLIVPFWLVIVLSGWRSMLEAWPACLVAGGSFAIGQFLVSNYHGPWLVDIVSAIVSLLALIVLLRFWQPPTSWQFADEQPSSRLPHPSRVGIR